MDIHCETQCRVSVTVMLNEFSISINVFHRPRLRQSQRISKYVKLTC